MPPGVVDQLEIVEVNEQNGPVGAAAAADQDGLLDALLQAPAVGKSRQRVEEGQLLNPGLGQLALRYVAQKSHQVAAFDGGDRDLQVNPLACAGAMPGLEALVALVHDALDLGLDLAGRCDRLKIGNRQLHHLLAGVTHGAAIAFIDINEAATAVQHPVTFIGAVDGFFGIAGALAKAHQDRKNHRRDNHTQQACNHQGLGECGLRVLQAQRPRQLNQQ